MKLLDGLELQLLNRDLKRTDFRHMLVRVRAALKHFAAIENLCRDILVRMDEAAPFPASLQAFLIEYRAYWDSSIERITDHIESRFDMDSKRILTHSNSHTITSLLGDLHERGHRFTVVQTLSSPGEEGRAALRELNRHGIRALLVDDEKVREVLPETDMVFMGCDTLLASEFLNKSGTRRIAESAHKQTLPFILATESRKQIRIRNWKRSLQPDPLFEWVPLDLVTAVVTER